MGSNFAVLMIHGHLHWKKLGGNVLAEINEI